MRGARSRVREKAEQDIVSCTSQAGVDLIKRYEGFSAKPYLCPAGVWTIGYGWTHGVTKDTPNITEAYAADLLIRGLERYENSVKRLITVPLTQGQFDALVSFAYNLGGGALQRSTLRARLNRGDYKGAAEEFMKWVKAGGRTLKGLVLRRASERAMFLGADI